MLRFMGGLRGTLGGIRVIAPARIKNLLRVKEGCLGLYDLRTMSFARLQCGTKKNHTHTHTNENPSVALVTVLISRTLVGLDLE